MWSVKKKMKFELNEYHRDIPESDLLEDIKRVALLIGSNTLSKSKYRELGKYGDNTICRRFGSWTKALQLCGISLSSCQHNATLVKNYRKEVTTAEIIEDIQRVALELNKDSISSGEYKTHGRYSSDSCFKKFKTWNAALSEAGLKPYVFISGRRINDLDLLEDIERMWLSLGRQPTTVDVINGLSKYSLHAYAKHFGGWRNALKAFVEWINVSDEVEKVQPIIKPIDKEIKIKNSEPNIQMTPIQMHSTTREINLRLRFRVMQRDNFKCCICGASPAKDPSVELHIDHIKPWSKGGETTIDNLRTLCSKCNLGKSDFYEG